MPELDLPLALPDLPGICDDLAYNEEIGPGIAPSLIAALPDLSQLTEVVKPITRTFHEQSSLSDTTTPLYFVAETLPLPPPPIVSVPPPPPPPPPPPQLLANTTKAQLDGTEIEKLVSKPAPIIPQPTDDLRSSLMAAIREAGGTGKLKVKFKFKCARKIMLAYFFYYYFFSLPYLITFSLLELNIHRQ